MYVGFLQVPAEFKGSNSLVWKIRTRAKTYASPSYLHFVVTGAILEGLR